MIILFRSLITREKINLALCKKSVGKLKIRPFRKNHNCPFFLLTVIRQDKGQKEAGTPSRDIGRGQALLSVVYILSLGFRFHSSLSDA